LACVGADLRLGAWNLDEKLFTSAIEPGGRIIRVTYRHSEL